MDKKSWLREEQQITVLNKLTKKGYLNREDRIELGKMFASRKSNLDSNKKLGSLSTNVDGYLRQNLRPFVVWEKDKEKPDRGRKIVRLNKDFDSFCMYIEYYLEEKDYSLKKFLKNEKKGIEKRCLPPFRFVDLLSSSYFNTYFKQYKSKFKELLISQKVNYKEANLILKLGKISPNCLKMLVSYIGTAKSKIDNNLMMNMEMRIVDIYIMSAILDNDRIDYKFIGLIKKLRPRLKYNKEVLK